MTNELPTPAGCRWYSWTPDVGFEDCASAEEAQRDAKQALDDAGDLPEDIGDTQWGLLVPFAVAEIFLLDGHGQFELRLEPTGVLENPLVAAIVDSIRRSRGPLDRKLAHIADELPATPASMAEAVGKLAPRCVITIDARTVLVEANGFRLMLVRVPQGDPWLMVLETTEDQRWSSKSLRSMAQLSASLDMLSLPRSPDLYVEADDDELVYHNSMGEPEPNEGP